MSFAARLASGLSLAFLLVTLSLAIAPQAQAQLQGLVPQVGQDTGGGQDGSQGDGESAGQGSGAEVSPEAVQALIDALQDEHARQALIAELQRLANQGEGGQGASAEGADGQASGQDGAASGEESGAGESVVEEVDATVEEAAGVQASLGRRIADITQGTAQAIAGGAQALWDELGRAPDSMAALGDSDMFILWEMFGDLALAILATYSVFLALRYLARRLYRAMGRRAAEAGALRTLVLIALSTLLDVVVVLAAWAAGYLITLTAIGEFGQMGIRQTLYLNAFLVVELAHVAVRAIFSPATGELRVVSISDHAARTLNRWLAVVIGLLGYGQLLIMPIVNETVSYAAGRAVSMLISILVIVLAGALVMRHRHDVARWLLGGEEAQTRPGVLRFFARNWHVAALLYLAALLIIVLTRPDGMLFPVLSASGQIVLVALAGLMVTGFLGRAIIRGIKLPSRINTRLPLLERRLNTFVPKVLLVLRVLVFLAVALFALHIIGLVDLGAWMSSDLGIDLTGKLVSVILILLAAFLVWLALTSWVDYRLNPDYGSIPSSREQTLLTLLRNAATIALLIITLMFTLSELGLDIAPLLASAGVLGLAIGFGAQKMVQDIITGIFIQFENAINVGDVVTVGGTTGVVERLTIRSVSLRDLQGVYHIVPFSSVDMVSNFMRGFSYHVCDMGIAYREDIEEARQAMFDAYEELRNDEEQGPNLIGDMEWFGLNSFGDSAVVLRSRIKTLPGKQWGVGRAYNAILKRIFDARGIEIPFPHQTLYFGVDKDGTAPPARILMEKAGKSDEGKDEKKSEPSAEEKEEDKSRKAETQVSGLHDDDPEDFGEAR